MMMCVLMHLNVMIAMQIFIIKQDEDDDVDGDEDDECSKLR